MRSGTFQLGRIRRRVRGEKRRYRLAAAVAGIIDRSHGTLPHASPPAPRLLVPRRGSGSDAAHRSGRAFCGAIGAAVPLQAGLGMASVATLLERAFSDRREGRRGRRQFARRLSGLGAPDLQAHPGALGGEENPGPCLRRGCGGLGRLHDRLRGDEIMPIPPRSSARSASFRRASGSRSSSRVSASTAGCTPPAGTRRCSIPSAPKTRRTSPG